MADYTTIDDPSAHFQIATWTGNQTDRDITNDGNSDLKPDFIILKTRSVAGSHMWQNSTRGVTKYLRSHLSGGEGTASSILTSFNTDGFGLSQYGGNNQNGETNVAWQWKANGGTTSSNTNGDITATVQANTDAGFSIGSYTGNGSDNQTIGHGLGATPDFVLIKRTSGTANWASWHKYNTHNHVLRLNITNTESDSASGRLSASGDRGSSTIFTVFQGSSAYGNVNENNETYLFWAWKEIQGYSKFGFYKGNSSDDGSFVYLGFAPAWLLIKRLNGASNWNLYDNRRESSGGGFSNRQDASRRLFPNNNELESANTVADEMEFTANGFKLRGTQGSQNSSSGDYTYIAFAENPFVTSTDTNSIPTTAR